MRNVILYSHKDTFTDYYPTSIEKDGLIKSQSSNASHQGCQNMAHGLDLACCRIQGHLAQLAMALLTAHQIFATAGSLLLPQDSFADSLVAMAATPMPRLHLVHEESHNPDKASGSQVNLIHLLQTIRIKSNSMTFVVILYLTSCYTFLYTWMIVQ